MRFAALSLSLLKSTSLRLSVSVSLGLFCSFYANSPILSSALLAISALPFLFFKPFGFGSSNTMPIRVLLFSLPVRITSTCSTFCPNSFTSLFLFVYLFIYLFLFFWGVEITIYTFDVLHHHNLDINS